MAESEDLSNGQLPLKGVVLCCTSVPQDVKTKITDAAVQMGATHKLDLTADVTHLIVGSITTPKYRYVAKDRPDIKVLKPSWIDAVRELWMEGIDVDAEALEREHNMPPFTSFHICVTGFDDVIQRNKIAYTAEEQGATYHGDLTKVVTHLIARKPEGAKYNAAKSWGTHVVSLKWFEESLWRGMGLYEKLYDPNVSEDEQGIGAFKRYPSTRKTLGKRGREGEAQDGGKKKLRRTASTRLESQSQDMWQDISTRSVSSRHSETDQWKEQDDASTTHVTETTFSREAPQSIPQNAQAPTTDANEAAGGLFGGIHVLIHGFESPKVGLLLQYLEPNGARVVHTLTELEDASHNLLFKDRYLLVPHGRSSQTPIPPEVPPGTIIATEWWVERCLHHKRLLDPAQDALSRPLADADMSGFSELQISTTGFGGVDLRQVAETVKLMGATYQEKVLSKTSVLISGSNAIRKEKAFYAQKHHIPVVSADWLWACMQSKKTLPFDEFSVSLPALDATDFAGDSSTSTPAPSDMQEGCAKDARKANDTSVVKRLSNTRSKHATPSLPLQASKLTSIDTASKPWPTRHGDENEAPSLDSDLLAAQTTAAPDRKGPNPLQEVSPNLSPRKTSQRSRDGDEDVSSKVGDQAKPASHAKPASPPQSPVKVDIATELAPAQLQAQHNFSADLADIIHRSRPNSAAGRSPEKRKKRPLGRAPSGISNRSNSSNLSSALPAEVPESLEVDGFCASKETSAPPSTQLGYETPEAEAHRLQMSKKLGTKLHDDHGMTRVASVGTLKDSTPSSAAGVGGRVRTKQRSK